jgi:hypothetical protein
MVRAQALLNPEMFAIVTIVADQGGGLTAAV